MVPLLVHAGVRRRLGKCVVIAMVAVLWVVSCAVDRRPAPTSGAVPAPVETTSSTVEADPCSDGDVSECYVKIGEHNGVLTCFVGTATCWDGEWGDCGGGELHSAASARNPGGFKSLGPPVPCLDNPCDPTCRHYDESPPVAWSADTDAGGDYLYTVKSETYEASCPDGETPQWSLFGYDTACPADSEVVFSVRTAESTQDLAAQPWVEVATAKSTPVATQVCPLSPGGGCPIDLYAALGLPAAHARYLELGAALSPSSSKQETPSVTSWSLTYSCLALE